MTTMRISAETGPVYRAALRVAVTGRQVDERTFALGKLRLQFSRFAGPGLPSYLSLTHIAWLDGTGHDHLTDADAEHFATLARALLAEAALTGNRGDYGERLRARLDAGREVAPVAPVAAPSTRGGYIQRDEAIARIRAGLKLRSGKAWSVTGGTGTARGWIYVNVPPKLRVEHGGMNEAARAELGTLFGLDDRVHFQGLSIAPEERVWHVARAEGNAS